MALWKYFKQEVKTPLPSPTGSLSRAILLLIRRFDESIIFNDSHSKTIIVIVQFSSALEYFSNGGHKNIFVNVMASNH